MIHGYVKVRNMPSNITGRYVVVRLVDGELWYYGNYSWSDKLRAQEAANEMDNVFVIVADAE